MYDFAHPIEDALEGVTHSMCTLEFEVHRPLYDWVIDRLAEQGRLVVREGKTIRPQQREFARLNITYTVMSKRYLRELVEGHHVDGWDDPRMPTLCGLRRRGYTPESLFKFVETAGVAKANSIVDYELLEHCIRTDLDPVVPRRIAVLDPLKVVITNYPEDKTETFELPNNPKDETAGKRAVPFSRVVYVDREDFMENPPGKFFRSSQLHL
jgi:glutaminyl-tRNA synthetase